MADIFGLVDCNNFYASCEQLFQPSLEGRPVIVLSNNDGCVISRSREARQIGIQMGRPAFQVADIIKAHKVRVFSTNYTLYGDLSQRIMNVLAARVPDMEIYSIDEAFIDLSHADTSRLEEVAEKIRNEVHRETGIPVSIGVGPTKTLAKAANFLAKSAGKGGGVRVLSPVGECIDLLSIPVREIWGVGDRFASLFDSMGITTALELRNADANRIRELIGIVGQRLVLELRGEVCYPLNQNPPHKKEVCTSRSFGHPVESYEELEEAAMTYAAKVATRLRGQGLLANAILVFIMTNKYDKGPKYVNHRLLELPAPTNDTALLIHHARAALKALYRKGYRYKKAGIVATDLVPQSGRQTALWDGERQAKTRALADIVDRINQARGGDVVRFAVQGDGTSWKMRQHNLSPRYTTRWSDLPTIDMDRLTSNSR